MRLVYWAASLVLLVSLALHTVPYVARDFIVFTLLEQGAQEAKLKRVSIDWLSAKVGLQGLAVRHNEASVLEVDRLDFDIYLKELFDDRLRLSGLRVEGAEVVLQQQDQLILLGPIALAGGASADEQEAGESSLEFGSDRIELVDLNIELLQPTGAQRLGIERLNVGGLYQWAPLESTDIRFVGHLNGAPVTIDSSALPLPERKTVSVNIALRELELTPLLTVLEPDIAARLDANLSIDIAVEGFRASVSQSGSLGLSEVDVSVDDTQLKAARLFWRGESQQQLDLNEGAELLQQIVVDGVFTAEGVALAQGSQNLQFGGLEAESNLTLTLVQQLIEGSASLTIDELGIESEEGRIELLKLTAEAPLIASAETLAVGFSLEDLVAEYPPSRNIRLGAGSGVVSLMPQAEEPIWQPGGAQAELSITQIDVDMPELYLAMEALELSGHSTSFDALDQVALKTEIQGLVLDQTGLTQRLSLNSPGLSADINATVSEDLQQLQTDLSVESGVFNLSLADESFNLSGLSLAGPIAVYLPKGGEPVSADNFLRSDLALKLAQFKAQGSALNALVNELHIGARVDQEVGDLDLNLRLKDVDLSTPTFSIKGANPSLQVNGALGNELQQLSAQVELASDNLKMSTQGNRVAWSGFNLVGPLQVSLSPDAVDKPLSLDAQVTLGQLSFTGVDNNTELTLAELSGAAALSQQDSASLNANLSAKGLSLQSAGQSLLLSSTQISPKLNFADTLGQLDPLAVSGSLGAALQTLALQSGDRRVNLATLDTELSIQSQPLQQRVGGTLSTTGLSFEDAKVNLKLDELKLKPTIDRGASALDISSPLSIQGLSYLAEGQRAGVVGLSSNIGLSLASSSQGDLSLQQLEVGATRIADLTLEGDQPVKLAETNLERLLVDARQQINLQQLELGKLLVGSPETPLLSLESLKLDRASYADSFVQLGSLVTQDLIANLQTQLTAAEENAESKSVSDTENLEAKGSAPGMATPSEKRLPVDISLQGWSAQGRTELNYRDASLAAPLALKLVASQISAGTWDSRAGKALPLTLRATLNDSADISLDANLTPLRTNPTGDWKLKIAALPMPILSPLVQTFAGYQIRSGSLNLDSSGTLEEGQLKGNNAVRIQRLEVQRAQGDAASETDRLFTMPLPSAVSLLESDERVIKLDLPVSGNINDPKFNYQDVIQIVVTKGVKEGAMAYLTNSLQPFGAIFMVYNVVKDANESGRFIQLQPLEFDPGSSELNQTGRDYAAKLAGMMQDRPTLTLEICPVTLVDEERLLWDRLVEEQASSESPLPEKELGGLWDQRIGELAAGRVEALRSVLVRVGVENERIFPCIALNGATEGAPRVELAF